MKKIIKITILFLLTLITLVCFSKVKAATATISANKTSATVGDKVTVTVTINAATWNLNVSGSATDNIVGYNSDAENEKTTKTYNISTTKAGTYKVSLLGDITDGTTDHTTEINSSVTVTVKEKETTDTSGESTETKTPKFSSVNETVYATAEVYVRKSYSTSSSILASLSKGDSVKRTGIGDNGWSKITYNGQTAYVYSEYLSKTKPVIEEPNTTSNETKNEIDENKEIDNNTIENVVDNNTVDNTTTNNEDLRLSKLEIAGVNFTNGFNPETYSYELKLNFFVKELNLTAVANKEDAKIEIIGNENFTEGENNITILVKSADEKETVTYQIKVIVPSEVENNPQNSLQFYLICGGIILAAIVAIIVVIVTYKIKNRPSSDKKVEAESYKLRIDEQYNDEEKTRRTKGKHSN